MLYLAIIILVVAGAGLCYYMTKPKRVNSTNITQLFPATIFVTREMIAIARVMEPSMCIGAKALQSILPEDTEVNWCENTGYVYQGRNVLSLLSSTNMMEVTTPQEVTFQLIKYDDYS